MPLIKIDDEALKHLGVDLREIRRQQGVRPRDIARAMEVAESYVAHLESGRRTFSVSRLRDYLAALDRKLVLAHVGSETEDPAVTPAPSPLLAERGEDVPPERWELVEAAVLLCLAGTDEQFLAAKNVIRAMNEAHGLTGEDLSD